MGNALRLLCGNCCKPKTQESDHGVSALVHDLANYENNCQVPARLSQHVAQSKKAQAKLYNKLLQAWKEAKPQPKTAEQASRLVYQTLKGHPKADIEGLLRFYSFPLPSNWIGIPVVEVFPPRPEYELQTFPVDAKAVGDGDGLTVYVDAADPSEAPKVPQAVRSAALRRSKARASRDYRIADALQQNIIDAGYRVDNENNLAKTYKIRMRGIDAPEMQMPYGKEAKAELTKLLQGKCLTIGVYCTDQYDRLVGDIHCNGKFAQKAMLTGGHAWHYEKYDKRPEFKKARAARVGLWASPNPQKPWEWRKNNPNHRNT
ncbi:uncharacterized 38.1 kDa protein-like isoform X2 [Papaver somniferum]|uniref:uncharacterized 38.1 kDa protein-like isoform X2 n=1 Tax=Papaver somniferum TaxID=3469 RepID=UPI000E6F7495|nr:uncharacterized 38.1 kDa protein-like isoform X2 [Papaver somniferum]